MAFRGQHRLDKTVQIYHERLLFLEQREGLHSANVRQIFKVFANLISQESVLLPNCKQTILRHQMALLSQGDEDGVEEGLIQIARALLFANHLEAAQACGALLDLTIRLHPDQCKQILDVRDNYAYALCLAGRLREAVAESRVVYDEKKAILGPQHAATMNACSMLAFILAQSGAVYEALQIGLLAFEARRDSLGEFNSETLTSQAILGLIYMLYGEYSKSEQTLRSTVAKRKTTLKPGQHEIVQAQNRLAKTLLLRGQFPEAETILKQPYPDGPNIPGPRHRWCMNRTALLAQVSSRLGRHAEAKTLAQNVLEDRKAILGPNHPDTLSSMHDLAEICRQLQEWNEAQDLALTALKATERHYGPKHPSTIDLVRLLGLVYADQGFAYLAEMRLRQALFGQYETLHEGHPQLWGTERDYVLLLINHRKNLPTRRIAIR